jgi:hypothetical protein
VKNRTEFSSAAFCFKERPFVASISSTDTNYDKGNSYSYYVNDQPNKKTKDDIVYKLNNYLFRSDDFSKESSIDNFLFAGCSQTVTLGLPLELSWAHKVNSGFDKKKYINISGVGLAIDTIISNIVHYIDLFGKPKAVVALFPDHYRVTEIKHDTIATDWLDPREYDKNVDRIEDAIFKDYLSFKNLEMICKANNIPLVYSSWQPHTAKVIKKLTEKSFLENGFDIYENIDIDPKLFLKKNSKYPHYWEYARDGIHCGERDNLMFAQSFTNKLKKLGF